MLVDHPHRSQIMFQAISAALVCWCIIARHVLLIMHTNLHNQRSVCPQTVSGMHMTPKQTTRLEDPTLKVFEVSSLNTYNADGALYISAQDFF